MKFKFILTAMALAGGIFAVSAQSHSALKLNEVMVVNENSIVDEYGMKQPWIELFNSSYAPLEISSVFLTNDPDNKTMYAVPLGDAKTLIEKRQHVVFFADGDPDKGTFHTNFVLVPGQENWIGIYDAGGVLIDQVTIPADLKADNSYACSVDGNGDWMVRDGSEGKYITPSSANIIKGTNPKVDMFAEKDSAGWGLTLMAMCIVFGALLVLCLCFYGIGKIGGVVSRTNKMRAQGISKHDIEAVSSTKHDSGEEIAAIILAMHEHLNAHDNESAVLTINKVKRAYSPWSSKIYNLREVPELRRNVRR